MKFSHIGVFLLSLILLLSLTGCKAYDSIYGSAPTGNAVYVPDSSIATDESSSDAAQGSSDVEVVIESDIASEESAETAADESSATDSESADASTTDDVSSDAVFEITETETAAQEEMQTDSASEDTDMEMSSAAAIVVSETDLVSLVPSANDPDGDALLFAFTSPLDENGEWQTSYGDAGEYTVTITASDGDLTTTQDVLVVVTKKEEVPTIDSFDPIETSVSLTETDALLFAIEASDLNSDALSYEWKLDGVVVSEDPSFEYQATYDDSGSHTVKVDVTDGVSSASRIWAVDVTNVNRKPLLDTLLEVSANENEQVVIPYDASDMDGDAVTVTISDSRFTQEGSSFVWNTDYSSAGEVTVTISATDGEDTVSQAVTVTVANVNRQPVILAITQKKQ